MDSCWLSNLEYEQCELELEISCSLLVTQNTWWTTGGGRTRCRTWARALTLALRKALVVVLSLVSVVSASSMALLSSSPRDALASRKIRARLWLSSALSPWAWRSQRRSWQGPWPSSAPSPGVFWSRQWWRPGSWPSSQSVALSYSVIWPNWSIEPNASSWYLRRWHSASPGSCRSPCS